MSDAPPSRPWPSLSFFAPVYDDEHTITRVVEKAVALFEARCPDYEIWLINDASPDNAAQVIEALKARYPKVRSLTHPRNLGYGLTIRDGLAHANRFDLVAFCDGDDQFDVNDLTGMVPLLLQENLAAVITRRTTFPNGPLRTLLSRWYNFRVRRMFGVPFADISCSLKLFRRQALEGLAFTSESPFIDAEVVIRLLGAGGRVKEVGIPSYPRLSGKSHSLRPRNLLLVSQEMRRIKAELKG